MGKEGFNIEDIFQESFKDYTKIPDGHVLRKVKFKLWVNDFFSLRPNKINIFYASLAITGIIFTFNKSGEINNQKQKQVLISETVQESNQADNQINDNPISDPGANAALTTNNSSKALAAIADYSLSATRGCAPLRITFKNTSINAEGFEWNFGNGEKSFVKNPSHIFSKPGKYKVRLKVKNNISTDERISEIEVLESPKALIDINSIKSNIEKKTVHFINKSKNSSIYFWDFGDGKTSKEKNALHTYSEFGIYRVSLIVKNELGCSDTATLINKFIEKNYLLSFPNTFRPNPINPENNGFYLSAENEKFVFYPKNNGVAEFLMEIFAGNGIKIFSTKDIRKGWNGYIKGRIAPPGVYFYKSTGKYPNGESFIYQGNFKVIVDNYDYY